MAGAMVWLVMIQYGEYYITVWQEGYGGAGRVKPQ